MHSEPEPYQSALLRVHPVKLNKVLQSILKSKTPIKQSSCDRKAIAYHEAGHAIMAIRHGGDLIKCQIYKDSDFAGGTEIQEPLKDPRDYAIFLMSGLISQYLFTGRLITHDYSHDYISILFIKELNDDHIMFHWQEAINEVIDEESNITKIAKELLIKDILCRCEIFELLGMEDK